MQNSPSSALLAANRDIGMGAWHLIFHMNSLWGSLARLAYQAATCFVFEAEWDSRQ